MRCITSKAGGAGIRDTETELGLPLEGESPFHTEYKISVLIESCIKFARMSART